MGRLSQLVDNLLVNLERFNYASGTPWADFQPKPVSAILEERVVPVGNRQHGSSGTASSYSLSPNTEGTFNAMNISQILGLIVQGIITFETDQVELQAGTPVLSPFEQIGTTGGKPLYGALCLSTSKSVTVQAG